MKWWLALGSMAMVWAQSPKPQVCCGRLDRVEAMPSAFVDAKNIDIWLPQDYTPTQKYAVLYMHDGQMLYDAATTWNKQAWEVDETAQKLIDAKQVQPFIVVGIWNHPQKRHAEYFPQKPYAHLTLEQQDWVTAQLREKGRTDLPHFQPISDNYLKFIVEELKPYIDRTYATYADASHTFVAGSSMGGLISWYAMCEYPNVFGGAACLSTHWPGVFGTDNNPIPDAFIQYLQQKWPSLKNNHLLYMDCGDQTLDALYPPLQKKVDEALHASHTLQGPVVSQLFPGTDHSEKAWQSRLSTPLTYLLTPKKTNKTNLKKAKKQ